MLLDGQQIARPAGGVRLVPLLGLALATACAIALLVAGGAIGGLLVRLVTAIAATAIVLVGWRAATGRARAVRGWMALGMGIWAVTEAARLDATLRGEQSPIGLIAVISLGVCAGAAYVTAAHGRMRPIDEAVLYLDSVAVFCGMVVAVVVIGSGLVTPVEGELLVHFAFLVGILASAFVLALSTRVPFRLIGPWETIGGVAVGAIGYLGLLLPGPGGPGAPFFHAVAGLGTLLVAHGAANWTDEEDDSPQYAGIARSLRGVIPLVGAIVTAGVGIAVVSRPAMVSDEMRLPVGLALSTVVVAVVVRQTLLLIDRERVLDEGAAPLRRARRGGGAVSVRRRARSRVWSTWPRRGRTGAGTS